MQNCDARFIGEAEKPPPQDSGCIQDALIGRVKKD